MEKIDCVGLNGKTSWTQISDHFSRMLIGDTRTSKATPLKWLKMFLDTHSPKCNDKHVMMDQGGELYKNPKVKQSFKHYGHTVQPTGAGASNQIGPVERNHRTIANHAHCLLDGANLAMKFWPHAFHHMMRILNALVGHGQTKSPIEITTNTKANLQNF